VCVDVIIDTWSGRGWAYECCSVNDCLTWVMDRLMCVMDWLLCVIETAGLMLPVVSSPAFIPFVPRWTASSYLCDYTNNTAMALSESTSFPLKLVFFVPRRPGTIVTPQNAFLFSIVRLGGPQAEQIHRVEAGLRFVHQQKQPSDFSCAAVGGHCGIERSLYCRLAHLSSPLVATKIDEGEGVDLAR